MYQHIKLQGLDLGYGVIKELIMEFLFWTAIIIIGLGLSIRHFQPDRWEALKKLIKN